MRVAVLILVALYSQHQQRPTADQQLIESQRLRDLALFDRAEEILRAFLRAAPADPQQQKSVPQFRAALCELLLAARKYDELKVEAEPIRKQGRSRVHALSLLAAGAWHSGQAAEALELCDEADKAALDPTSDITADQRRRLKTIRALLGWKRFESTTHIAHYPPDSPIAADPAAFGRRLDVAFERVRAELDVTFEGKIEAFFFNDQAQADTVVGRTLASALPALRTYFARVDGPPGFAIAQVVSFFVANRKQRRPPRLPGLCDGFFAAHADDPRWERRREEGPRNLAGEGKLPELEPMLAAPAGDAEAFALRASFVRWLIKSRGRENFRRLWAEYSDLAGIGSQTRDLRRPWVEIYGAPPGDLEAAWRSSIR